MFRRSQDDLIARFHKARDAVEAHMAQERWRAAVAESQKAERIVLRLQKADPSNPTHVGVYGATCYNQALLWDRLGMGRQAVKAARRALQAYGWLDPAEGNLQGIKEVLDAGEDDTAETARLIAHAADARARLARLLAKHRDQLHADDTLSLKAYGDTARGQADNLGHHAVRAYEELIDAGHYGQADLDRVKKQHAAAVEHLYGDHRPDGR